jgi:hypothetical protein
MSGIRGLGTASYVFIIHAYKGAWLGSLRFRNPAHLLRLGECFPWQSAGTLYLFHPSVLSQPRGMASILHKLLIDTLVVVTDASLA